MTDNNSLMPQLDGDAPEDQVPRRLAWEQAHPGAPLTPPCRHEPRWTAELDGGTIEVKALELGLLLDKLDRLEAGVRE